MKTLGGELGFCPDDSALIPALMALDAEVNLAGNRRPMGIEDYLKDRPGDLILSIAVPDTARPCIVLGLSRTSHSRKSLVVAACLKAAEGSMMEAQVVVSDCRGKRVRLRDADVAKALAPEADMHASAEYKRYMAGVMVADAVSALAAGKARP